MLRVSAIPSMQLRLRLINDQQIDCVLNARRNINFFVSDRILSLNFK